MPPAGWLMLHSGSRNIGKELAERHIAVARKLPHNQDLPDRDLAVFVTGTPEMDAYRRDLTWAQEYAARNRAVMLALLCHVVRQAFAHVQFDELISCHHNYVAEETYGGVDLLVTRKGAIRAGSGDLGIIPGRWAPARTSCVASATRRLTAPRRTAPVVGCPGRRRARRSPSRTWPNLVHALPAAHG